MPIVFSFTLQRTPKPLFESLQRWAAQLDGSPERFNFSNKVNGWTLLNTAERVEVVFDGNFNPEDFLSFLALQLPVQPATTLEEIRQAVCCLTHEKARLHWFRLAAGLESAAVGEKEILTAIEDAWIRSIKANTCSLSLSSLFQRAIRVGNRVRLETGFQKTTPSVSQVLAQVIHTKMLPCKTSPGTILILGEAPYLKPLVQELLALGLNDVVLINPCTGKSRRLAQGFGVQAGALSDVSSVIQKATVVVNFSTDQRLRLSQEQLTEKQLAFPAFTLIDLATPQTTGLALSEAVLKWESVTQLVLNQRNILESDVERAEHLIAEELNEVELEAGNAPGASLLERFRVELEQVRLRHVELHSKRFSPQDYENLHRFSRSLSSALLHKLSSEFFKKTSLESTSTFTAPIYEDEPWSL